MRVKVPPSKRKMTPYLPTMTRLGIREVEAGNRTQPEVKQMNYTGVNIEL
jgi:hypothetical protein